MRFLAEFWRKFRYGCYLLGSILSVVVGVSWIVGALTSEQGFIEAATNVVEGGIVAFFGFCCAALFIWMGPRSFS